MPHSSIYIKGMSCQGCVKTVTEALKKVPHISAPSVDLASGIASFDFQDPLHAQDILQELEKAGKSPEIQDTIFNVEGMTCSNCAEVVRKALELNMRVLRADVSLAAGLVKVQSIKGLTLDLLPNLAGTRYKLTLRSTSSSPESASMPLDLKIGILATAPLFLLSMAHDFNLMEAFSNQPFFPWLLGILGTTVQFTTGLGYYRGAYASLKMKSSNMDVLIALGSSVAWGISIAVLLGLTKGGHLYFESAAMILTLVRLGKWIEEKLRLMAQSDLKSLFELSSQDALALIDGKYTHLPIASIVPGTILRVAAGEKIPLDSTIISGTTSLSESMLTGENTPIKKSLGDLVFGGTINLSSTIEIKTNKGSEDGVLAEIIRQVIAAQSSKGRLGELADKISRIFVPVILLIAAATLATWLLSGYSPSYAFLRAAAVLVVACPCALGLATPTALIVGVSQAAKEGILVRDLQQMENLGHAKTLLFDKTGTLTEGLFQVTGQTNISDDHWALFSSLESYSKHPIATAISQQHKTRWDFEQVQEHPGLGIQGIFQKQLYQAGSPHWALSSGVPESELLWSLEQGNQGRSVVVFFSSKKCLGSVCLSDKIRPEAHAIIAELQASGIEPVIVSGDQESVVKKTAQELHITKYFFSVTPKEKLAIVKSLPPPVAMVGDGLNDAPALSAASAGIAVSSGSDLAKDASGIILFGGGIAKISRLIKISKATVSTVKQNLWWAFGYNLLLIPIATGAFNSVEILPHMVRDLDPMLAAIAMSASSLSVLANSLLLKAKLKRDSI